MTKKICETCLDRINEFDRFRAVCAAKSILMELAIKKENTTVDTTTDLDAEDAKPARNSHTKTHHAIVPNATESCVLEINSTC